MPPKEQIFGPLQKIFFYPLKISPKKASYCRGLYEFLVLLYTVIPAENNFSEKFIFLPLQKKILNPNSNVPPLNIILPGLIRVSRLVFQRFFLTEIFFLTKNSFDWKFFWPKILFSKIFFTKIFSPQNFFQSNFFIKHSFWPTSFF